MENIKSSIYYIINIDKHIPIDVYIYMCVYVIESLRFTTLING